MPSAQAGQHGDWAADGHGGQAPTGAATVVGALLTVVGVVLAVSGGAMSLLLSDEGSGRVGDEVVAVGAGDGAAPTADVAGPGRPCGPMRVRRPPRPAGARARSGGRGRRPRAGPGRCGWEKARSGVTRRSPWCRSATSCPPTRKAATPRPRSSTAGAARPRPPD